MSTGSNEEANQGAGEDQSGQYAKMPKQVAEFNRKVDLLITPEAKKLAMEYLSSDKPEYREVTPPIAAAIHRFHNKHNRDFRMEDANSYAEAMGRGEWRRTHQGFASYEDATLGDGQHRCAAIVISGTTQTMMFSRIERDAADVIDGVKGRTAADSLKLAGVQGSTLMAQIAKDVIVYLHMLEHKQKPKKQTNVQVKNWVLAHGAQMNQAVQIGTEASKCSDPAISIREASSFALLMIFGGYDVEDVSSFLTEIQKGQATYQESPTLELGKKLYQAKHSDKKSKRINAIEKFAIVAKAAQAWKQRMSVRSLVWKANKEELPSFNPPVSDVEAKSDQSAA